MSLHVPDDALELAASIARRHHPGHPITHPHAGADSERASVGLPGHCDTCAIIGHVAAHPDYGCGDVRCDDYHPDYGCDNEPSDEDEPVGVTTADGSALITVTGIGSVELSVWSAKTGQNVTLPLDLAALAVLGDAISDLL